MQVFVVILTAVVVSVGAQGVISAANGPIAKSCPGYDQSVVCIDRYVRLYLPDNLVTKLIVALGLCATRPFQPYYLEHRSRL